MEKTPSALFVIDVGNEKIAIKEAQKLGIPVIAVIDANHNPDGLDYIIPGNDDSISSNNLYCRVVADTILETKLILESQTAQTTVDKQEVSENIDKKQENS